MKLLPFLEEVKCKNQLYSWVFLYIVVVVWPQVSFRIRRDRVSVNPVLQVSIASTSQKVLWGSALLWSVLKAFTAPVRLSLETQFHVPKAHTVILLASFQQVIYSVLYCNNWASEHDLNAFFCLYLVYWVCFLYKCRAVPGVPYGTFLRFRWTLWALGALCPWIPLFCAGHSSQPHWQQHWHFVSTGGILPSGNKSRCSLEQCYFSIIYTILYDLLIFLICIFSLFNF